MTNTRNQHLTLLNILLLIKVKVQGIPKHGIWEVAIAYWHTSDSLAARRGPLASTLRPELLTLLWLIWLRGCCCPWKLRLAMLGVMMMLDVLINLDVLIKLGLGVIINPVVFNVVLLLLLPFASP